MSTLNRIRMAAHHEDAIATAGKGRIVLVQGSVGSSVINRRRIGETSDELIRPASLSMVNDDFPRW